MSSRDPNDPPICSECAHFRRITDADGNCCRYIVREDKFDPIVGRRLTATGGPVDAREERCLNKPEYCGPAGRHWVPLTISLPPQRK